MQNIKPVVSVIVPIYKVEKYLQQCIDSICRQTYSQLEIILVDDGSPDCCGSICDRNAVKDSRIVVIHKKNGGLSSARNAGIDIAKGEYISFVDADDELHASFIEVLIGLCEKYSCDIAQCDFLTIAEDSLKLPLNSQRAINLLDNRQALHELCSGRNNVKYTVVWNKVYKKALFDNIRYPVGRIHEDEFTAHLVLWNARKIAVTNQYLYYYLQRSTSITGKKFTNNHFDVLDAFKERLCFLKENKLRKDYLITLGSYLNLIDKYYIMIEGDTEECKKIRSQLLKEKERYEDIISIVSNVKKESIINYKQIEKDCSRIINSKIVLYGAGYWGRIYYQWIRKHDEGRIVGWVDNFWNTIHYPEYQIMPLDSIRRLTFDYVLITIKDKCVQRTYHEMVSGAQSADDR